MLYTTANLISEIERRSFAPANQSTFSTQDILDMATEEMESFLFPELISIREEYFVYFKDYTIQANKDAYAIPARSFGNTIREVKIIRGNNIDNLPRVPLEDVDTTTTGEPAGFYLQNGNVVLYPKPSTTANTLRLHFYLSPSNLIETSSAGVITAIDTNTNVVTLSNVPSTWTTGDEFDLISKVGMQECKDFDLESSLISGDQITFGSLPSTLSVGDYVALAGESPLIQCPGNLRRSLAQSTAAAILENMLQPGGAEARTKATAMLEKAIETLGPRVRGENEYIQQSWF